MYGFIVNTTAGSGKGNKVWKKAEAALKKNGTPYLVSFTEKPQDAGRLAKDLVQRGVNAVVAVGGDGTVNETAEVLLHKCIPLGVIPAGSGNDFARSLAVSNNVDQALSRIIEYQPKKIDVLSLGDSCCLTVTGIGFDAAVAKAANESYLKKWFNAAGLGRLSYAAGVLHVLTSFSPTHMTITIDGHKRVFTDVWLTAVANAPNYGGNIRICPDAENTDGYLNLCILHGRKKWPLLRRIPSICQGKHRPNKNISFFKGKDVHIHADSPVLVQSDGEVVTETPVRVQILPGALTVL
ncbi:diacylglycerol/lipid kinase family protein [Alkalicoccus daliensis]|uniref:Lipid kinase, YegS/Rv2252/BmrU family n=1 Tax=Alkalicoccus daliensis TaxID=745820 RepID=A0A1H0JY84_9BACI|nr:diacylglycerol kinase family protein [Alkalicoccus daliensis]SDO48758.1 lipid kinase, YegS/Rv2252/BmrU family [Alkalicoccus daliensis]